MKKILIIGLLLLIALSVFGQNKFKYPVNANGGLRVGGDDHSLIDSVKLSGGTLIFYIGGVEYTTAADTTAIDTTSLSDRIDLKLNFADTSVMLTPYINRADTSTMLSNYLKVADIIGKLNISDTATMLSTYILESEVNSDYIAISDTSTMLTNYINKADTATMLSNYALLSEIGGVGVYVEVSDTSTMLTNYILESEVSSDYVANTDTATMLANYILTSEVNATYANKALSNLASVAINTHLLPASSGSANLGSALLPFGSIYANGTVSLPSTTSIGSVSSTEIGYVNNVTSAIQTQFNATKTRIDSIVTVLADTANIETLLQIDFDTDTVASLSDVRSLAGSGVVGITLNSGTLTLTGDAGTADDITFYTNGDGSYNLPAGGGNLTIMSEVQGWINDSLDKAKVDIRKFDSDTIPLFVFGLGSGHSTDTALFNNGRLAGAFYNSGSDTLYVTELRGVLVEGTGIETIDVQVSWHANMRDVSAVNLNTSAITINNMTTGTSDVSFNNNGIPPGQWVWCVLSGASSGNKPTALMLTMTGYRRNRSY